jgi:hypothetical protein
MIAPPPIPSSPAKKPDTAPTAMQMSHSMANAFPPNSANRDPSSTARLRGLLLRLRLLRFESPRRPALRLKLPGQIMALGRGEPGLQLRLELVRLGHG